ncbi:MAG: multidrug ABC transporter substrate-binding protein [Gammaproteobacteria bacterium RBG_16_57_12]|nr:MAG: multidrug ABC transporter substrate-binding protein [Gammaproteobacteria bacterium RBG_16_57_12]
MLWNSLMLAMRAIRVNALRSVLTMLGIIVGVAAVITMVNLGRGATEQVSAQIASLGSNLLTLRAGQRFMHGQSSAAPAFSLDDVAAILRDMNTVAAAAPIASQQAVAVFGNANWSTNVTGTDNEFFVVRNWAMANGRQFTDSELHTGKAACIIGATVRKELFGNSDPIGDTLRLKKVSCEVIGVLAVKGQTAMGSDQDDIILLPLRTYWRRIAGNQDVAQIHLSAHDGIATSKVKKDLEILMRERRHIGQFEDDNFTIRDMQEIADTLTGTTRALTSLLGTVAAISLVVGGIGIMNIMLVSVTERTREIGIRLAVGAMERDVMLQFLVEAVALSSLGGIFGIVLSFFASYFISGLMDMPFIYNPGIVVVAFLFSASVGVIFGYVPARRAARLDPIVALRHE